MSKRAISRIFWIPSLIAIIAMLAMFGGGAQMSVATPGALTTYSTADKVITVDHPDNWTPKAASRAGELSYVRFSPQSDVRFEVEASFASSLMSDIERSPAPIAGTDEIPGMGGGGGMGAEMRKTPLEKAHEREGEKVADTLPEYEEQDAKKVQIAGMEALISEFTAEKATVMTKTKIAGFRATIVASQRNVMITCYAPVDQMKTLRPVFDKMVRSLQINMGGA